MQSSVCSCWPRLHAHVSTLLLLGRLPVSIIMCSSAGAACFAALGTSVCHKCIESIDLTNCTAVGLEPGYSQQPFYTDHLGSMQQLKGGACHIMRLHCWPPWHLGRTLSKGCSHFCAGLHLGGTHIAGFFAGLDRNEAAMKVVAGLTLLDISEPRPSKDPILKSRTRARTQKRAATEPEDMLRIVACLLRTASSLRSLSALGLQQLAEAGKSPPLPCCSQPGCSESPLLYRSAR